MAMVKANVETGTRSYPVVFASPRQAILWIDANARSGRWLEESEDRQVIEPQRQGPLSLDELALLDRLYPQCEHGLSLALCAGPGHYPQDNPWD